MSVAVSDFGALPDGRMVSLPPEDMFPFLDREQLQSHLLFPLENQGD